MQGIEIKAYDATETDMLRQQGDVATALAIYKALEAGYKRAWKATYQGHLTRLRGENANHS